MRRHIVPTLLVLYAAAGLAADETGPYSLRLAGKAFDERCLTLAAGESIRYSFRSSAPVDFNIHYHRGKDVFYPVRQAGVKAASGVFRAEATEGYCLMWEHAGDATAAVEGSVERVPAR